MFLRTNSMTQMLASLCLLLCLSLEARAQTASKGTLQGRVVLNDQNGPPAKNTLVIVYGGYEKVNARTNGNGEFKLTLSVGRWKVVADLEGYRQQPAEAWGNVTEGRTSRIIPNPIVLVSSRSQSFGALYAPPSKLNPSERTAQAASKTSPRSPSSSLIINRGQTSSQANEGDLQRSPQVFRSVWLLAAQFGQSLLALVAQPPSDCGPIPFVCHTPANRS